MRQPSLRQILQQTLLAVPLLGGCNSSPTPQGCGMVTVYLPAEPLQNDCNQACLHGTGAATILGCMNVEVDGGAAVQCDLERVCGLTGRRPHSLRAHVGRTARSTLGSKLAADARFEAASVAAFDILGAELRDHRAPAALRTQAAAAVADEVRHARSVGALARRYGGQPVAPAFGTHAGTRPLETLALENAVEGCVREAFGVVVGCIQTHRAADPAIRRAMAAITRDEWRHAELGFSVAAWAEPQLSRAGRRRVGEARQSALQSLFSEAETLDLRSRRLAGLPDTDERAALAVSFATAAGGA